MYRTTRKRVTIMEMLVVLLLISLILGALAWNFMGVQEKGKADSTRLEIQKIENYLNLELARNPSLGDEIESNWGEVLKRSPLSRDPEALTRDAWGRPYRVEMEDGEVKVISDRLIQYDRENR